MGQPQQVIGEQRHILLRDILLRHILLRHILLRDILLRHILLRDILLRDILLRQILFREQAIGLLRRLIATPLLMIPLSSRNLKGINRKMFFHCAYKLKVTEQSLRCQCTQQSFYPLLFSIFFFLYQYKIY